MYVKPAQAIPGMHQYHAAITIWFWVHDPVMRYYLSQNLSNGTYYTGSLSDASNVPICQQFFNYS